MRTIFFRVEALDDRSFVLSHRLNQDSRWLSPVARHLSGLFDTIVGRAIRLKNAAGTNAIVIQVDPGLFESDSTKILSSRFEEAGLELSIDETTELDGHTFDVLDMAFHVYVNDSNQIMISVVNFDGEEPIEVATDLNVATVKPEEMVQAFDQISRSTGTVRFSFANHRRFDGDFIQAFNGQSGFDYQPDPLLATIYSDRWKLWNMRGHPHDQQFRDRFFELLACGKIIAGSVVPLLAEYIPEGFLDELKSLGIVTRKAGDLVVATDAQKLADASYKDSPRFVLSAIKAGFDTDQSPLSKSHQVVSQVVALIAKGALKEGQQFPALAEIALVLGIYDTAVNDAFAELVDRCLVENSSGRKVSAGAAKIAKSMMVERLKVLQTPPSQFFSPMPTPTPAGFSAYMRSEVLRFIALTGALELPANQVLADAFGRSRSLVNRNTGWLDEFGFVTKPDSGRKDGESLKFGPGARLFDRCLNISFLTSGTVTSAESRQRASAAANIASIARQRIKQKSSSDNRHYSAMADSAERLEKLWISYADDPNWSNATLIIGESRAFIKLVADKSKSSFPAEPARLKYMSAWGPVHPSHNPEAIALQMR